MLKDNAVLHSAIDAYGKTAQVRMCIEEMSELTKALCKLYRAENEAQYQECIQSIREEIADVRIMTAQMEMIFGDADDIVHRKVDRLRERMKR